VGRYCAAVVSQMTLGVSSGHSPGGRAADSRLAATSSFLLQQTAVPVGVTVTQITLSGSCRSVQIMGLAICLLSPPFTAILHQQTIINGIADCLSTPQNS